LCAPTLTAAHASTFKAFIEQHQEVVLKPLDGMGGKSIFRLHSADPNINVVLETLTQNGTQLAMAQGFLPAIAQGDKRILMIGGEAWPRLLARIPAAGESRGNLAAGGRGEVRDLGPAEAAIAAEVGPWLREQGVWFAGLDVIGDKLTEINVTSPTCVREIENADGSNIASALWDAFEQPLRGC
jgi:glutathione synthase